MVDDYPEGHLVRRLGLAAQHFPAELRRRPGESLGCYRDRMHNDYKVATMFAALNDPKCAYVEVVNPLLHRAVVKAVSELPDELRQWEVGYATMVEELVPEVPFDRYHAEAQADEYLGWPAMREELLAELSTGPADAADDVLPAGARARLAAELALPRAAHRRRSSCVARSREWCPRALCGWCRRGSSHRPGWSRCAPTPPRAWRRSCVTRRVRAHVATQGHVAADGRALT